VMTTPFGAIYTAGVKKFPIRQCVDLDGNLVLEKRCCLCGRPIRNPKKAYCLCVGNGGIEFMLAKDAEKNPAGDMEYFPIGSDCWRHILVFNTSAVMDDNKLIDAAMRVMKDAHAGQQLWDGKPYETHPIAVSENLNDYSIYHRVVALLHDCIEDNPNWTFDRLRQEGFPEIVVDAVDALTHRKDETYLAYIVRARENIIARVVKEYDILHNLASFDTEKNKQRADKYQMAIYILRHECK